MEITQKENRVYFNYDDKAYANISIHKKTIRLELIKTLPKFRKCGYATRLFIEVLKYIRAKFKSYALYLNPLPLDPNGLKLQQLINFYKKFGFRQSSKCDKYEPYLMEKFS